MTGDQSPLIYGKTQASKTQNSVSLEATDNYTKAFLSRSLSWTYNYVTLPCTSLNFKLWKLICSCV